MKRLHCRACKRQLKDRLSLRYGIGPGCREGMTDEQLAAALKLTAEEAKPGYVPPDKAPSWVALANNEAAREAAAGIRPVHLDPAAELALGVRIIIAEIRAERTAARDARWRAAKARQVENLELFEVSA